MPAKPNSSIERRLLSLYRFVFSAKFVPILKGTIAYTLALSLIMIRGFADLSPFPPALSSMIILTIAGEYYLFCIVTALTGVFRRERRGTYR